MTPGADKAAAVARPSVLIVDDNRNYREAFRRNLLLEGYEVIEAEDSDEAMARLRETPPGVMVTDLSMRHATEGLELIRQARSLDPILPIIMISAVGTFEEGAAASRMGARHVISKSKIEEEMEHIFKAIDQAYAESLHNREQIAKIRALGESAEADRPAAEAALRKIVTSRDAALAVKSEAFELLLELDAAGLAESSRQDVNRARIESQGGGDLFADAGASLQASLPDFAAMDHETQEALRTAEFLHLSSERAEQSVDFSRSIGFSYCFAVENEAKFRLRKRFQKFFGDSGTPKLVRSLLEENGRSLSVFYHQYLLRLLRDTRMDLTIDNIHQTLQRMLEHGGKYKPDGLKALGIVMLCFGRTYSFRKFNKDVAMDNPLGIRGLENDKEVFALAELLTNLQHYRNPYIHPEISEMEKISKIRQASFDCLALMHKLA